MDPKITVRYIPVQQDYANVLRLFFLKRTGTRISLAFLVIAFVLIIFALIQKGSTPTIFELIWLLLPPLFVIFVIIIQPNRIARQAAKNEQLVTETTWIVSDEGVQISSQFGSTHLGWDALNRLAITKEYYLLLFKDNKTAFRFLPRRAFTSPDQEDMFLKLVAEHLPQH